MSKRVKELVTTALERQFAGVKEAAVVDFTGVTANDNNRLRGGLKASRVRIRTVKNSLARRAFDRIGLGVLGAWLDGPCALAYGGESIVDTMRALDEWVKQVPAFKVRAVYVDGAILEGAAAAGVARWPNRIEMLGQIVGRAMGPGGRIAGQLLGPGSRIAGQIKTLVEKLEESAPAPAAEPPPAADGPPPAADEPPPAADGPAPPEAPAT